MLALVSRSEVLQTKQATADEGGHLGFTLQTPPSLPPSRLRPHHHERRWVLGDQSHLVESNEGSEVTNSGAR